MAEPNEPPHSAEPPDDFLLRHLPVIEKIVACYARRRGLLPQDAKELLSWVHEKLVEDDYRRIRTYRGSCPPAHFLAAIIGNLGKDFLDKLWQRWRPCVEAIRLGPVAVTLDRLLHRDGKTFDEAYEELRTRYRVTKSREELEEIARVLPKRLVRRMVGEEDLEPLSSADVSPEEAAMAREESYRRAEILKFLRQATIGLPADERNLLRLHVGEGHSIADIARAQQTDQKALYRRRDKILRHLRDELSRLGVRKEEIDPLFGGGPMAGGR